MVTPVASGVGIVKLSASVVTFATQLEHVPLGGVDESVPGVVGVTWTPEDGDER